MKHILVLGAGQSSPYLIHALLRDAQEHDWFVNVGDLDVDLAWSRVQGHSRGSALHFDVNDDAMRSSQIEDADVVVNMLAPAFRNLVAWDCVRHGTPMLSVSYMDRGLRDMDADAHRRGILLLCELGLDPGIDHMSAMLLIQRVRDDGGRVTAFRSYGSGIPAPEHLDNPLKYVITWNPRNVVMAGEHGAQYMERGRIKLVPSHQVFHHTWPVEVEGVGLLEAYANRDSLTYMKAFGLVNVHTMIRGTLRWPGWSETWAQIVQLGLPNETLRIPGLAERTYREVLEMFLPLNIDDPKIGQRLARYLKISPTGGIMQKLRWLGLLSDEKTGCRGETAAAMLVDLLKRKLPLGPEARDMVVLAHELDVDYPASDSPAERITSTLVARGEAGGFTAMSRTVGLPVAIATKLLLKGELPLTGAHLPTHPSIYEPVLRDMAGEGLEFREGRAPLRES